jgi:Flp pilus assembly protein TadG
MNMKVLRFKKGQSLVEFALLLPLLLGIVFIIVDFGRVIYYYTTIYNACQRSS